MFVIDPMKLEVLNSFLVSTPIFAPYAIFNPTTSSSRHVFPALSPIPFTVQWTWFAPSSTLIIEFATASPKSLWKCTLIGMPIFFLSVLIKGLAVAGVNIPTVSGTFIVSVPAFSMAL